jgi:hypothetical protein
MVVLLTKSELTSNGRSSDRRTTQEGIAFPTSSNILETEVRTAVRVATLVFSPKIAGVYRPEDVDSWLRAMIYKPEYGD